jgi:hypothetical protein
MEKVDIQSMRNYQTVSNSNKCPEIE